MLNVVHLLFWRSLSSGRCTETALYALVDGRVATTLVIVVRRLRLDLHVTARSAGLEKPLKRRLLPMATQFAGRARAGQIVAHLFCSSLSSARPRETGLIALVDGCVAATLVIVVLRLRLVHHVTGRSAGLGKLLKKKASPGGLRSSAAPHEPRK
ncbi:hypothetical protein MTO96_044247 [Rhipicephalus appendiculatus]